MDDILLFFCFVCVFNLYPSEPSGFSNASSDKGTGAATSNIIICRTFIIILSTAACYADAGFAFSIRFSAAAPKTKAPITPGDRFHLVFVQLVLLLQDLFLLFV